MRHHIHFLIFGSAPLAGLAASLIARRRWSFVAGACLIASLVLWIAFGVRAAFVAATLGAVAWFWDERNRLRPFVIEAERERRRAYGEEEFDEEDEDADEFEEDEFDEDEFAATDDEASVKDDEDPTNTRRTSD